MTNDVRIAYDARFAIGQYRGMGRYLRRLIAGREQELLGFCAGGEYDHALRLVADGPSFYPLWEQVAIPRLVRRHGIEVFIAPYNTAPLTLPRETSLVLIVHDLIYMQSSAASRSMYQNSGRIYRRLIVPHAIHRADVIITVSKFTASSIVARFGIELERITILPNSIGQEWFASSASAVQTQEYVLTVAGEAPSKNLHRAIEAFAACCDAGANPCLRMKVAGVKPAFHGTFAAQARALGIGDRVEFLPYLGDQEMRDIYRGASALFMPSLAEGFGIPVLEAMASGIPVAASNVSSLPEIGGDAACYFDPLSTRDMAESLLRILGDSGLRARLVDLGRIQARKLHPSVVHAAVQDFWSDLGQLERPLPEVSSAA